MSKKDLTYKRIFSSIKLLLYSEKTDVREYIEKNIKKEDKDVVQGLKNYFFLNKKTVSFYLRFFFNFNNSFRNIVFATHSILHHYKST